MRPLLITTALVSIMTSTAHAEGVSPLCKFYGGHIDLEGKIGNQRNIGEMSVFLPLACKEESLLYTDIRLKRDNIDNMEGNFGLGIRQLYQTGIWGNYFYFDRKISGITDKYHSQLTFGSEWLAESWEIRANAYMPVTGEKSMTTAGGIGGVSLSGNNIFVQQTAGNRLIEEPLYGGDAEVGFKIPDTKFWLHAGGYSFHGNDVDDVSGGRVRARYDLTKNISLSAEGQYDDVRGRQGWIGVRFTLPFGEPAKKAEGLKARMTASPVRDVDIVTQSKKKKVGENSLATVINSNSGTAQRILYVDNSAAAGGDGSKENPFRTLSAAQAALQDNDIVYVSYGDGTSTGLNQGFTISRNNVQLIGSGTDFVFDGNKMTINSLLNPAGIVLIGKTSAPTLTNNNAWQNGINISAANTTIAGINFLGGQYMGINATANGVDYGDLYLRDVSISNNGGNGIFITLDNGGKFGNITFENVTTNGNDGYGTRINLEGGNSKVDNITFNNFTSSNNTSGNGMGLFIGVYESDIGNISLNDIEIEGNSSVTGSLYIGAGGSASNGTISSVSINRANILSNAGSGFYVTAGGLGSISSVMIDNSRSEGNGQHGYFIETYGGGSLHMAIQNSTAIQNQLHGLRLNKDMGDTSTMDLGGAGLSIGRNSFYGNGLSNPASYYDIHHAFGNLMIESQNNWWGQSGGPIAGQINTPARFNTTGALSEDPNL